MAAASGEVAREQANADSLAEVSALAGGLAHEIRNPLSVFSLNVDLLIEDFADAETPRDRRALARLKLLEKECGNLERILNDFLQFVRAGSLELEPVDLNAVVREFIDYYHPQAHEKRVEVSPHLDPNLPPVKLDQRLFRQVLVNLAQNAQQAMPDGGVLELQTHRQGDRVLLDVIDTGRGMDDKTRTKLFEAFYSTKQNGTGLGLPTVRRVVEAHDGTIECASEPGRGTQFTISLPAAEISP
jgi:signal transduction histidine kinase